MPRAPKTPPLTHPEPGDATALLTEAIEKQDMAGIEAALLQGALPEKCHFGQGKTSDGNALSRALHMKDLDLLSRLMDAGATGKMSRKFVPLLMQTQHMGYAEAFVLFLDRLKTKPTFENTLMALGAGSADFLRALDALSFLPRNEPLKGFPAYDFRRDFPPLFIARSRNLFDYLVETGADPFQVVRHISGRPVDAVDLHLKHILNFGDGLVPLIEANFRTGKTVSAAQMTKVADKALNLASAPIRLLSFLAEHCPGWTWQRFLLSKPDHQSDKSNLDHLQALEDDRRLRGTLEETLPEGRVVTPRRSL
jgi:hypothetical protein